VILSFFFEYLIERSNSPYSLRNLLEIGLWIDIESLLDDMINGRIDMLEYKLLSDLKSLCKIESSNQSFKRIGENIWIFMSSSKKFATRELYHLSKSKLCSNFSKITTPNERGSYIREFPFWLLRIIKKELFRNNQLENSVSEKFKTLITLTISLS
jgi:hypothetical protein